MQDWQNLERTAGERFRLLVMNMPDVVWTTDQEGRTTFISPNIAKVYGFTPEEIYREGSRLWLDRIHPADLARVREAYELLFSRDQRFDVEYRIRRKDGCWIWLHDRAVTTYEKDGVRYADGLFSDITGRMEAEEALRQERDFTSAVLDTAGVLVVVLDRDGRIVRFNRACETMTGYSFEEARGHALWDLFLVPEEVELVRTVFEQLGAGQFPNEYESHWLTRDGARRLIAWSNTALLGAGGAVEYIIDTGIDITQRKQAEAQRDATLEALRKAHENLELRVLERTAELQESNKSLQEEITERMRAQEALQALVEFEDAIARISGSFVNLAPEQVDDGIHRALQTIGKAYHVDRACVFQFSGDRTRMDCTHEWHTDGIEPQIDRMQDVPISLLGWTVERIVRLEVVQIRNVSDLPPEASGERAELQSLGLRSRLVVPMVYRGMPVGFVGFDAARARPWTEQSLKLQVIGDIFVNALEHKRAQAIQAGQRQFLELLATGGEFSETLHTLVRLIEDQWPGMLGLILLLDEDGRHLHIGAAVSLAEDYVQSIEGLEIGPMVGSCGTACYRRERVIVEDTATDPRWDGLRDLALQYGLRACWSEPVFSPDGRVVGTFAMYFRQPRAPTEAELRAIEMGAHLVGVAIEHKQAEEVLRQAYQTLEQRVEERTKELATLNAIASVASHSLDLREIMNAALDKTLETTNMEFGTAYSLEGSREQAPEVTASEPDALTVVGPEIVAQIMLTPQDPPSQTAEAQRLRLLAHRGVSADYAEFVSDVRLPGTVAALARAGKPFVWLVEDAVPANTDFRRFLEREECRQVVTLPLIAKGNLVGAINLGTRRPRTFSPDQLSLLAAVGQQIGVAVENARLYEAEQERWEEAEGRRRVAEGMREILAVLNSRQSLPEILDFIATQTCRLLNSDAAAILRLEEGVLRIQTACGLDADYIAGMAMPLGQGGAGRALATHEPAIVKDLAEAARRTPPDAVPAEPQKSLLERLVVEFRAILSVPLIVQGQDYGAITVYYRNARDFSDEDLRLAMGVANQAALAVESARLREQARQAAAMEERGRLARELHDSVTQSLYSVTMYTEAAARLMPPGQEAAAEYLREARDTAQEALREMRLMIYQLRPPVLEKGGLAVALQVRLDAVERRGGMQAELMVEGEDRLPPAVQAELHQIAQEALNNALKHAHAGKVQVRLHFGDAATRLEVQDDGVGFDLAAAQAGGGLGLPGMVERAQRVGGRLEITSAPGQGTQVVIEVPSGGES